MVDPTLEEVCRAHSLQTHVFRRLQRHLRDVVDPQLAERLALIDENAALKAELEALKADTSRRPRKRDPETVPA